MENFDFINPTRIIFGKDKEKEVGAIFASYNIRKVLVVYGSSRIEKDGLLQKATDSLKENGIEYWCLSGIRPNPTTEKVYEGVAIAKEKQIEGLLAIGGGSPIDTAKLIAAGYYYDGDPFDFNRKLAVPKKSLPVGVILTHASAGSESSDSAVVQDDKTGVKSGFNNDLNRPLFAIENPELTYGVSPYQTACGVVDSMMHSLERYFNASEDYQVCDDFALAVVKRLVEAGKVAVANPTDYQARGAVMLLSSLSHDGLTGIGKKAAFVVHPLEHALSGYNPEITHGAGIALIYPAWARYVVNRDIPKFARLAEYVFNISEQNETKRAIMGIAATESFFASLGMPSSLEDVGLSEKDIPALVKLATGNGTRRIGLAHQSLTEKDVEAIYSSLLRRRTL